MFVNVEAHTLKKDFLEQAGTPLYSKYCLYCVQKYAHKHTYTKTR